MANSTFRDGAIGKGTFNVGIMPRRIPPAVPTQLEFEKALMFFHAYMYGPVQGKLRLYGARQVHFQLCLPSDWEVLASILLDDLGTKLGAGVDLAQYEVKSAKAGSSFEYQYHKNSGREKLRADMRVGHLFFTHENNLRLVELRFAPGSAMRKPFFAKWLTTLPVPYVAQRFRRSVPFGWVKNNAKLLMRLKDGEVDFPETTRTAFVSRLVRGEEP